jgi:cell shape-determining protein MreD
LVAGCALGFMVPFVCSDLLGLQRDVYYGVYSAIAFGFFGFWAHSTEKSMRAMVARRWRLAIVLGLAVAAVMAFIVLQQDATSRPSGFTLGAAVLWRGVV